MCDLAPDGSAGVSNARCFPCGLNQLSSISSASLDFLLDFFRGMVSFHLYGNRSEVFQDLLYSVFAEEARRWLSRYDSESDS